jgi:hypothetical protein
MDPQIGDPRCAADASLVPPFDRRRLAAPPAWLRLRFADPPASPRRHDDPASGTGCGPPNSSTCAGSRSTSSPPPSPCGGSSDRRSTPTERRDLPPAYLDRRHPRWREDAQGDAAAGSGPARSGEAFDGKMTKEEQAYQTVDCACSLRSQERSGCGSPGDAGIGHLHSVRSRARKSAMHRLTTYCLCNRAHARFHSGS